MKKLTNLLAKAETSAFYLFLLNKILHRVIPFNKPHSINVVKVESDAIKLKLPFKKKNLNHIKSLHACAMLTVAEYASGMSLIRKLDPGKFRIILKEISMTYHYQGKTDAFASYSVTDDFIKGNVLPVLENQEFAEVPCEVDIFDTHNNLLARGKVQWHIKSWSKVQVKV